MCAVLAALYEGAVGSNVHGGSSAAPMIADVFKEIYKGQQIAKRPPRQGEPEIRRAEPVEEDESD